MQSLMILGRQPALGLAELESLYGADKLRPVGGQAVLADVDPCLLAFNRLGGSVKFCKVLTVLSTTNWKNIEKFLIEVSPEHSKSMSEGKMTLGLSLYGFNVALKQIEATGLSLKKAIRGTGRPVRLVPNKNPELSSAQVLHNRLTGEHGWELIFVHEEQRTVIAQTVKVQDIEAYSARDQERPKRDTKIGMLPTKLAQIIINLAVGKLPEDKLGSICEVPAGLEVPRPNLGQTVLDPFCGTGVILQEAALMGYGTEGTDIEPRMIDYSRENLEWLSENWQLAPVCCRLGVGDATNFTWQEPINFVASEAYLGRPFTSQPSPEILAQTISDCNLIIKKFLKNIARQLKPGTRLCVAVPAWQIRPSEFKRLPLVDSLEELGYNQVKFEHVQNDNLTYYRPSQIVTRELLVIIRK